MWGGVAVAAAAVISAFPAAVVGAVVLMVGFVLVVEAGVGVEFGFGFVDIAPPHFGHSV